MEQQWMDGAGYWLFTTVNDKYTHNFLVSTRLYIYAIDLKRPTERTEKHISKYIVGKVCHLATHLPPHPGI